MMPNTTLRKRAHCGTAVALALLAGCGGERPGTPRVTMLSPEGANHQFARYAPDGTRVAYWAAAPKGWDLTVAAANLSGARTLDSAPFLTTPPLWSPQGSAIAYSAGADYDIWVASLGGGTPRRLTASKGLEFPLQWRPDGRALAYLASIQSGAVRTEVIGLATGVATSLLAETRPAVGFWSPDGSKIAYMVIDAGRYTIWLADSAGRNGRQLTNEGFEQVTTEDPWSPDGAELLYESRRTGTADVWVLPINGDSARQLTRDVRNDYGPEWSPDGTWVAFLSERGRQTDIWIVPAAGGTPERVTDDEAAESDMQWVPGTTEIAFTTGVVRSGLWTRSLAGGAERRLTPDSVRVGDFDLSPDGSQVVYQVIRGGGVSDLEIVPVAGGPPRTLVAGSAECRSPQWSPDGTKVLFISDRSGNRDVWVVDAAGGEPRDLTDWPTNEFTAAWSADGASVYFISARDATPLYDLWQVPVDGGEPRRLTRVGTLQGVTTSRASSDVFVQTLGGSEGQIVLSRLLPDGRLQTLWDRSSVLSVEAQSVMPSQDSIAVLVQRPGGALGTMLLPTHGGEGRAMLGDNEGVMDWSTDGTKLLYWAGLPNSDLYVMTLRDGATQRVTDTPDDEGGARWLPGGQSILFLRSTVQRRIATVDVGRLLAGGN
jgi:Tol biopolymer transport system component